MDRPCMIVGIDVSHAEPGSDKDSHPAIVASINGQASQYVAYITGQKSRIEIVQPLTDGMVKLLIEFKKRNNVMPEHIIIYRDGVSDGQFQEVISTEVEAIKTALALSGYQEEACKIVFIVCQKGHHTRLVYEKSGAEHINVCPGVLVDSHGDNSIVSSRYNEFYLNSHVAIQGTAKPCKYTLLYDSIGLKMSEIQLMTYWLTYLYARCNRSVSYPTPVYYAHWASIRAKALASAGATREELVQICNEWADISCMSFI